MLPSTGRVSSTNDSGSKPKSNTKNDMISQPSSRSKKNKVEAHHRNFKSSANKNNHVSDCNANVKNIALAKNSANVCLSCNECLFFANHDACVVKYLNDVQERKKAKSVKKKEKKQWKPTGRIFTSVGLRWKLTRRMFNIEGKIIQPSLAIIVPQGNRFHINKTLVVASNEETRMHYSIARNSLISYGHPFNHPNWTYIVEIVLCNYGIQMGNILILRVYYVKGLGVDLLLGSRGSNIYTISMADMMKSSPLYLLSKASKTKSWLWLRRLSHLNFDTINHLAKQGLVKGLPKLKYTKDHLCSACQMGKSKKESHPHKHEPSTNEKLQMLHVDFCGPMRVASINGKKHILVIVDDYSRFTWAEAVATACYTQNRSLIHTRYNKTPYELLRDCKPELKYLYAFSALCYPTNNFEDLRKLQPKADIGIFIGYSPSKKGVASTSAKPLTKNDWDLLFQPMFDEYFKPPSVVSTPIFAATLLPPDTTGASSSTSIDKDAPFPITSPNIGATNSPINSTNVERNKEVAEFDSDTFTNPFAPPDTSSVESSSIIVDTSNMHTFQLKNTSNP
ncbi:retrovirus-related pol polyprotein from transposon TNT 1-94 [Tanacetum coccineum]